MQAMRVLDFTSHLLRSALAIAWAGLIAAAALALLLGSALLLATQAEAQEDSRWVRQVIRGNCWNGWDYETCRKYRYVRVRHYRHPTVPREDYPDRRTEHEQCLGPIVDVLSTEHQNEDNAREAARKLMMAKIQWLYGSQYMDLDNAKEVRWRCSASNAHDTVSGRIAEATAKLTGREGQNVRCALWARPCRAPREADSGRDKRRP